MASLFFRITLESSSRPQMLICRCLARWPGLPYPPGEVPPIGSPWPLAGDVGGLLSASIVEREKMCATPCASSHLRKVRFCCVMLSLLKVVAYMASLDSASRTLFVSTASIARKTRAFFDTKSLLSLARSFFPSTSLCSASRLDADRPRSLLFAASSRVKDSRSASSFGSLPSSSLDQDTLRKLRSAYLAIRSRIATILSLVSARCAWSSTSPAPEGLLASAFPPRTFAEASAAWAGSITRPPRPTPKPPPFLSLTPPRLDRSASFHPHRAPRLASPP
mmetsp:Transcript_5189/g.18190  ORF Transcript_5189/g.18190 Transcript_5189/m.18190 type:complete len:278 (+) Transcript_5189:1112-1945(+)